MTNFNKKLKELRLARGITQEELAKVLGVSPSTVGMYESGKRQPNFEMEEKIADYFNVSLDTLRGISEEKQAAIKSVMESIIEGKIQKLTEPNKARLLSYCQALLDTQEEDKK